jgi:signal transduction histidine kinase
MKSFSLTRRVLATVVVCQLLLTAGITIAVVVYGRTQLRSAFDSKLASRAMSVLALVRYTETHPPHLTFERELLPPSMDPMHGDLFTVVTADGHVLARSDSAFPAANRKATGRYAEFMMGAVPYRAVWLRGVEVLDQEEDTPSPPDRVDVAYAASLIEMNDELTKLGLSVAGTSLLLLLVASALASWGVRRWLAPLRGLAEQAGAISVHDWTFRPPAEARMARELLPLTEAIETVLTRLRAAFQQQRDFTSDAAHELKTSVAILKSTVQSLQHKQRTAEDYRAGLDRLLEDCERLEELLRRMLCLARIERSGWR